MRAASVIPVRTSRALLRSAASTVVLRRMRFMPLSCHVPGKRPVVVYTQDAVRTPDRLMAAGARAVEDEPAALIGAVLTVVG